jgi:pilus assembly protein Flp/PilA
MSIFAAFLKDENATTAIEYALIAAGISIAIIVGVNSLGSQVSAKFAAVSTAL